MDKFNSNFPGNFNVKKVFSPSDFFALKTVAIFTNYIEKVKTRSV